MKNRIISILSRNLVILTILFVFQVHKLKAQDVTFNTYNNQAEISASGSITFTSGFYVPSGSTFRAYISNCIPLATSPSQNQNYILNSIVKRPGISNLNQMSGLNICDLNQTIQYFDGLGRPIQTVTVKGSPNLKDIVDPTVYDLFGREAIKYLPYADPAIADGSYKSNILTPNQGVLAFYNPAGSAGGQQANGVVRTAFPFSQKVFEASPLNRILEQSAPGEIWQQAVTRSNTGRTVVKEYGTNVNNEVNRWRVNSTGASGQITFYAINTLRKTITKDENWVSGKSGITEEFEDLEGHVILKRIWESETKSLSTYYVYDYLGNLRYVIPPGAPTTFFNENADDVIFSQFVYAYHYDVKNRMIEKKVPGKGWERFVYNTLDQVVLSQDANQKGAGKWVFNKYDVFGRTIIKGIINSNLERSVWQTDIDGQNIFWESRDDTDANHSGSGYTNLTLPTLNIDTYLSINYYDNYSFYGNSFGGPVGVQTTTVKSMLTGTKVNVLGTATLLLTTSYYDEKGRVIQQKSQNHLNGTDRIDNTWSFVNQLTASTRTNIVNNITTVIANRYEYDHQGRKKSTMETINGGPEVTLSKLDYNEIGQLMKKSIHSTDRINFTQNTNYAYNERGWMIKINDPATISASTIFGMELIYGNRDNTFNGNIGAINWKTKIPVGVGLTEPLQSYVYDYDKLNRLYKGNYTTPGALGKFNEELTYDEMGNVMNLKRSNAMTGYLNNFTYNYTSGAIKGNQLFGVSDAGTAAQSSNYLYDDNGNQKSDSKKGLVITYNMLDLPKTISKSSTGETLNYTYDAAGHKLRKVLGTSIRDYIGGIEYNNGALEFIQTEEGRALPGSNYTYEYILKDHLGNTRATIKQNGEIVQIQDYYAFGLEMNPGNSKSPSPQNNYMYNGKEKQKELGLDQLDYGARFYDPVIARWNVIDPLAAKHPHSTPYHYAFNNPIRFIDPDGRDTALYNRIGGQLITMKPGGNKTAIYTVDGNSDSYDSNNPWANAQALTYQVGKKSGGLSGKSFRNNHPLRNIGTKVGAQVFTEDLLNLTSEFTSLVMDAIPEFAALRGLSTTGGFLSKRSGAFQDLVTDDARYDLKSLITNDGTQSYAAAVIGEWSILNGTLRRYDDYGNISYGIFGLAAGFSRADLYEGSNLNQVWKDITGKTSGNGDERRDVEMIRTGIVNYPRYLRR